MKAGAASIALAALLLVGCSSARSPDSTSGRERLTFNMSWLPQGSMGGVIAAIDRGYYAQAGLNVSVTRGFGGVRTTNELDQGMVDFAYGDPISVALNHANGGDVRMIGPINTEWPAGLCYVKQRHRIDRPADLEGLTVGGGQTSPMQALAPVWLKRNGVDLRTVKLYQIEPALIMTSLIEGRIDAGECWKGNSLALFRKRAAQAGVTLGFLPYSTFGLDIYGSGILTTRRMIARHPATVRRFLAATYRGYAYAAAHPDATVAMLTTRFPTLDAAITRQQLIETAALMRNADRGFDPGQVGRSIDFLKQAYAFKDPLVASDIFVGVAPGR